ncbi:MAG: chromate transporter [Synechococcaceae cyanobacterium]|jgi:chromate transporter
MTPLFAAAALAAAAASCPAAPLSPLGTLGEVLHQFLSLSLFSLGGGNTLLAEYHHLAVSTYCWLSDAQFADLYALAEAAPGPSSMIVGLLGLGAGWPHGLGWALLTACTAEVAILLPSTLLMVAACLSWKRLEHSPWRIAFERGLGPVTLGLLFAVGVKIVQTAARTPLAVAVSLLVCVLMVRTRWSPLLFLGVAGVLGGLGVIHR